MLFVWEYKKHQDLNTLQSLYVLNCFIRFHNCIQPTQKPLKILYRYAPGCEIQMLFRYSIGMFLSFPTLRTLSQIVLLK